MSILGTALWMSRAAHPILTASLSAVATSIWKQVALSEKLAYPAGCPLHLPRFRMCAGFLVLVAALSASPTLAMQSEWVPKQTGWVNDLSGVLSVAEQDRISGELANYFQQTRHQITVLIVPTLHGDSIEAFSLRTANAWGIGNRGLDDGIVVALAMRERRARIELGKGMQRFISDADAKNIMDSEMTPRFAKGDFAGGLQRGLARLMSEGRRFAVDVGVQSAQGPSNPKLADDDLDGSITYM